MMNKLISILVLSLCIGVCFNSTKVSSKTDEKLNIIIMGPPASGKNLLCDTVIARLPGHTLLNMGDLLRNTYGERFKETLKAGQLLPHHIVDSCIVDFVRTNGIEGIVFNGCPRAMQQLKSLLTSGIRIDGVIILDVPEELLYDRIIYRWIHPASGRSYNEKYSPSIKPGIDDITGEPLVKRSDDTRETLEKRLNVYKIDTMPVIEELMSKDSYYYRKTGSLPLVITLTSPKKEDLPSLVDDAINLIADAKAANKS